MAVLNPASRKRGEHRGNLGERLEAEIEVHQPLAQRGRLKAQAFQGEIERVAGHLPEVGVAVLERAQPGVLELLVAPERGQRRAAILRHVGAARRGGGEVEQGAVGVEDAGLNAIEGSRLMGQRRLQCLRELVLQHGDPPPQRLALDLRISDLGVAGEAAEQVALARSRDRFRSRGRRRGRAHSSDAHCRPARREPAARGRSEARRAMRGRRRPNRGRRAFARTARRAGDGCW